MAGAKRKRTDFETGGNGGKTHDSLFLCALLFKIFAFFQPPIAIENAPLSLRKSCLTAGTFHPQFLFIT
jgi:hypothetical protein